MRNVSVTKVNAEDSEVSFVGGAKELLRRTMLPVIVEVNDVVLCEGKIFALELIEILGREGYELLELGSTSLQLLRARVFPRRSELLAVSVERFEGALARLQRSGFPTTTHRSANGNIQ